MNKVIIFGGNHTNALGMARVFGINNIPVYGIITTSSLKKRDNYCIYSKYWYKYYLVNSEEEGLNILLNEFWNETEKPVVMPTSDGAALIIDDNIELLSKKFYLPSINGESGKIRSLMNKFNQFIFAKQLGLKYANSWIVDQIDTGCYDISQIEYPCIVKPVLSPEGSKVDICRIEKETDLNTYLKELQEKNYKRVLIQKYLNKDYEMELFGSIPKHTDKIPFFLTKHFREYPSICGTVSCHQYIYDANLINQAHTILYKIKEYGYIGNIDIELFKIGDDIWLNEVNFRNSGDIYACFADKLYYPVILYLDTLGMSTEHLNFNMIKSKYAIDEFQDLGLVLKKEQSAFTWLKYIFKSSNHAYLFKNDYMPLFCVLFKRITCKLKRMI